ncbi:Alpha/Beta hydrolase protein [Lipomyces kononenkoae]|uniref:Alpha/Beta hydrolase protein n=1 Tax=Lipomyces kononenkoae TaxID=34357 RepID=A0ACC3T1T5_LIPKO
MPTSTIIAPSLGGVKITGIDTSKTTTQFRGLKFATIEKRYDYPARIDSYPTDVDATEYGPIPPQPPQTISPVIPASQHPPPRPKSDEFECLNLNIMRPIVVQKPLPVIVWIFPGGNFTGAASDKTYDSTAFVERSIDKGMPVLFVTINYRLSLYGFLYMDGRANHGLYDQLTALQWVKLHIADFGGNPHNITLMGESAGSLATHYHSVNENSKGLFRRIGMMSTVIEARTPRPLEEALEIVQKAKKFCGVVTDDELRTAPIDKLVEAISLIGGMYGPVNEGGFVGQGPFVDKLPHSEIESILLGNCRFEAKFYGPKIQQLVPTKEFYSRLLEVPSVGAEFAEMYNIKPTEDKENFTNTLLMYDDISYGQPMHNAVNSLRKAGFKTYHYLFDEPNPFLADLDAHHGVDVLYLFNSYKFDKKYDSFIDKYQTGWIRFANGLSPWGYLDNERDIENVVMLDQSIHEREEGEYEKRRNVTAFERLNNYRGKFDAYHLTKRYLM